MVSPFFIDDNAMGFPQPTPKFEFSGTFESCSTEYPIFFPISFVISFGLQH